MVRVSNMHVEQSLVFLVLMCVFKETTSCLIISEVNCDNPRLDTQEFVELYHDGMNPTSLDGYTLVFYNGKGDLAYRVINLSGHQTDQRGFFLVGSSELTPSPAIPLPPNSVQNGPDAIALYGPNWVPVPEGGQVSGVGLLDAVVYTSRKSAEGADGLASVLTPGSVPYIEDEAALEGDESIQRCWQSDNLWTFYTGPPTPAWVNHCPPPTPANVWINEVDLGGPDGRGLVELDVGKTTGSFSLVLYDVTTDLISSSVEFIAKQPGIFTVSVNTSTLAVPQSAALALYKGPVSDFPKDGPLSHEQPIDAFVYGDSAHTPSENLTETLIPGRKPFTLTESFQTAGVRASRCGVTEWTRDPGLFVTRPRSPGKPNDCVWFQTCPLNITSSTAAGPSYPAIHSNMDFLLNEINTDCIGGAEDEEFIELWHPSGFRMSLDFVWLVMINGQTGMVYYELELNGYFTDDDGYFLIGSSKVGPDIRIPPNTIQNGPDAIVLYRSKSPPSQEGQNIPRSGLLDAVVYRTRGSDKKVSELTEALTPRQLPLLEDINALPGDETLNRCGTKRLDLNAFRVASPTPRKQNNCPPKPTIPPPPKGLVINEFSVVNSTGYQSMDFLFVELIGPPSTPLNGLLLVFFPEDGKELSVPLTGSTRRDGFYVAGNVTSADQGLPAVDQLGAVLLCFEPSGSGVYGNNSHCLDWLVFSDDPKLQTIVHHNTTRLMLLFSSFSRCASDGPYLWITSLPSPGLQNLCPSPAFSSSVDLCLQRKSGNCDHEEFADLLEDLCDCEFIESLHVKGVNVSCKEDKLYAQGPVLAVSDQQRAQITESLKNNKFSCPAAPERLVHGEGSSVALQVGLVITALLLFALGAALFVYLYKKRRPADYLSMQMSEQAEASLEL
ncbi:uncharacterized protein si:ch211-183d21.1 [Megalobrama amblycephala]|uniref:uncharacterized protein si:ch211-183d21.1 n=1 Tax=Megalobrama amblycephala TaxID=75352 RepID=UPI002014647B|nr:uncharacterized protein si:ch211-183d21.1 [Megalobrama amblycephala]XP_048030270.1 uncharacterized protein si:ch211-183d21.1 [Megalobrama amblycephala]